MASGGFVPSCDAWLSGWDPAFSQRLAERGWLGLTLPREYGGGGRSSLDRYVVTGELLAAGAPVAAHWIADRQIGPSLLRYGSEVQRQRFLPGIVRGEMYFGTGMSEPGRARISPRSAPEPNASAGLHAGASAAADHHQVVGVARGVRRRGLLAGAAGRTRLCP
ncbi:MAG: acyl-CoA dehydrogenase family protein, partial [Streptosporangiaceae bacterium]